MFTGIVQGLGQIKVLEKAEYLLQIGIAFPESLLTSLQIGASVSVDGTCLTVVRKDQGLVYFDVVAETLKCTTLGQLNLEQEVNLERALKVGDELGGHQLSGHIMGTALVTRVESIGGTQSKLYFSLQENMMPYLLPKGFIAVNGVSLTLVDVKDTGMFSVQIIPETLRATNLSQLKRHDRVNIEVDYQTQVLVRTIRKYLNANRYMLETS